MSCGPELALREFAPSYQRATIMQVSLAIGGLALGLTAAWRLHDSWVALGALLLGASLRGGPHPCRLAGAPGASNSSSPFRNCTEALDTASASQSLEQAKVPHAVLTESPSEARPERTERRTHPCGRRNEATESQLGLSANGPTDRLGVPHPNRQGRGSKDSRPSLPARTALRRPFLSDFPRPPESQPLEHGSVQVRVGNAANPLGP